MKIIDEIEKIGGFASRLLRAGQEIEDVRGRLRDAEADITDLQQRVAALEKLLEKQKETPVDAELTARVARLEAQDVRFHPDAPPRKAYGTIP